MKKILIISHCLLNNAAKLQSNEDDLKDEDDLRKEMLKIALEKDIQIFQLPCPEYTLYGPRRWGHSKNQFENPFYKSHCKKILSQIIDEIEGYYIENELYEILAIVGVDGSPSCGIDYTYKSDLWMGEFSNRKSNLEDDLKSIKRENISGSFMEILKSELERRNIFLRFIGLYAPESEKVLDFLKDQ